MKARNHRLRLLVQLRRCLETGDVKAEDRRNLIAVLTELIVEAEAPPRRRYYEAMRKEVTILETLAKRTLHANPFSKEADGTEEEKWRELAHASRQLRPLVDAWAKSDEPNSETAQYKYGFQFRLIEAMATVAEVVEYDRVYRLKQRKRGRQPKKTVQAGATDAFDDLALECFSKLSSVTPASSTKVWAAIVSQIEKDCADGNLSVEEGGARIVLYDGDKRERSVRKSSFSTIFGRVMKTRKREPDYV
jgi:hypothetical protein